MVSTRAPASTQATEEEERGGLDIILDYAYAILALALLVGVATFFMQWRLQANAQQEAKAWDAMRERQLDGTYFPIKPGIEELSHLTELYKGSSAEPFILLAYGNALYERGQPKDLEEAQQLFQDADTRFGAHPVVGPLFRQSIESIASELTIVKKAAEPASPASDSDSKPAEETTTPDPDAAGD